MAFKFTFPLNESSKEFFRELTSKAVVVSFFGKSDEKSQGCKAGPADEFSDTEAFSASEPQDTDPKKLILIEGFHDRTRRVLFLHLRSPYDTHHFEQILKKDEDARKPLQGLLAECQSQHAKAVLFLFCVSHIVILSAPVARFETPNLQLFRILDLAKQKASALLGDALQKVGGLSPEWVAQLRPCAPRLLFYFQSKPMGHATDLQKLEHALEDQIYRLLRKCRIVTNSTVHSLFAIPSNQEFVFIEDQSIEVLDPTALDVNRAIRLCHGITEEEILENRPPPKYEHTFKHFLQSHIKSAFRKGFDDTLGRHTNTAYFELPLMSRWADAASAVYKVLLGDEGNSKHRQLLALFNNAFNAPIRFSEARCKKVLPLAFSAYQEGLPTHYTKAYHEGRLAHALSVFSQHARGPSCAKYIMDLQRQCDDHWHDGRQMCEVLSLTGNPCTQPLHLAIREEEEPCEAALLKDEPLPTIPHVSGVRYVTTCNCGRKQGPREDPFVLRTANCDFYAVLAADCCDRYEKWVFPTFSPSIKDFKAARVAADDVLRKDSIKFEKSSNSENLDDEAARLKQSANTRDEFSQDIFLGMEELSLDSGREKSLVRQASTTEYLPGMSHTASPQGLLPQFPSWSLTCLGPSSVYSHNHGLTDQPGFLPGSAYLLPWDVTVRFEPSEVGKSKVEAKWTSLGTSGVNIPVSPNQQRKFGGNVKNRKTKIGKDHIEFSVKIFLGVEYECPRGHRFMLAGPDKMLKASGSGSVKETGAKVASSDMPLYCLCPCKMNSKPLLAQLMRIHVVTPKAPVHITLNPRVQPAPDPCPVFVPGPNQPIKLTQSAYWILRLPYVYMSEKALHRAPKEPVPLSYGRLQSGCYGIIQATTSSY